MSSEQKQPRLCPHCGSSLVTQILGDALLRADFRGMECPSEGVLAYRCDGGHIFLTLRSDFRWGRPVALDKDAKRTSVSRLSLGSVVRGLLFGKT